MLSIVYLYTYVRICMYIGIHVSIIYLSIISCACLSDIFVPFQAIKKEVKLFSNKRRDIKRGIKALAKTVSVVNSHTNTFGPWSKMAF